MPTNKAQKQNSVSEKKIKVTAFERGLFLELDGEGLYQLGQPGIEKIINASTLTVAEPSENPNSPPTFTKMELWRMKGNHLQFPKTIVSKLPQNWEWNIVEGESGEHIKMTLRPTERFPIALDTHQKEILQSVRDKGTSGLIEAAMGAGKSWLLLSLVLGHPLLRPAAISGKGQKDTKQLLEKLKALNESHPEFAEKIIISGMGRSLGKRDLKILEGGEGIIVCTHAGLQNLPPNTKLLVLDEAHAASTPKRIQKILDLPSLVKAFGLTGTAGLRGDGGDELFNTLIGPTLVSLGHEHFEASGRVAPAQINGYHFYGKGIYAENPFLPNQTPQEGYSLHSTWIENHRGRHEFVADLILSLPHDETKVIFVPHIIHANRIAKALEAKIHQQLGDLTYDERENYKPVIFHAKADKKDKLYMSKEERERRVSLLEQGKIKVAISTDFLSTGFDTNMIDHIIDASGQKAIIGNIQRTGRGIRPRIKEDGSTKINQIHTILDKTHPILHKLGEKKFGALCAYYNHHEGIPSNRPGGVSRFVDAPWIHPAERAEKLKTETQRVPSFNNSFSNSQSFRPTAPPKERGTATFDLKDFKKKQFS
jgi:superfamily II DNA or RNA helicase